MKESGVVPWQHSRGVGVPDFVFCVWGFGITTALHRLGVTKLGVLGLGVRV